MPTPHIILIGAGGHAKVVLETAQAANIPIKGYLDDNPTPPIANIPNAPPAVGTIEGIPPAGISSASRPFLAIGNLEHRQKLIDQLTLSTYTNPTFAPPIIHPSAIISPTATIALGVLIAPGAIINADAAISPHAIINTGAIIEHDCKVGINTHIAPGAKLAGGVTIANHTLIGIGAIILPGITIGSHCTIGAGAVVTQDIPDHETAIGVPAKPITTPLSC